MMVAVMYEGLFKHLDGEALRAVTPLTNAVIALVATGVSDIITYFSFTHSQCIDSSSP